MCDVFGLKLLTSAITLPITDYHGISVLHPQLELVSRIYSDLCASFTYSGSPSESPSPSAHRSFALRMYYLRRSTFGTTKL